MKIETWDFNGLYRYLWGSTTDVAVFMANKRQLLYDFMVVLDTTGEWRDYFIVALVDEKIVGLLQYRTKTAVQQFALITVHKNHRRKGISKALIQYWAESVYQPDEYICQCTTFSEDGLAAIKPQLDKLPFKIQYH